MMCDAVLGATGSYAESIAEERERRPLEEAKFEVRSRLKAARTVCRSLDRRNSSAQIARSLTGKL
jgi:hypothetical protein